MKKLLTILLACVMLMGSALAMTACDGDDEDTLVCGVTPIPGLNEKDADGNWTIGFETEFALEVGKILGMKVEFKEIDWNQKYMEVNSGKIDCIWNGFTKNSSDDGIPRTDLVDFSYTYMLNQQCIVVRKSELADYTSEASLAGKSAAVEGGSAGADYAKKVLGEDGDVASFPKQMAAFLEVSAGRSDFAVVDILLAQNVCGKGDYADLAIVDAITLDSELYAVGFKKGSDLTAKVNEAIKTLYENGTLQALAVKYGYENVLQVTID